MIDKRWYEKYTIPSRRQFIARAGVTAAATTMLSRKSATADVLPLLAWSINLDGQTYLRNTGGIAGMPGSSDTGLVAYSYASSFCPIDHTIARFGVPSPYSNGLGVAAIDHFNVSNPYQFPPVVQLQLMGPTGDVISSWAGPIPYDGHPHTIIIGWTGSFAAIVLDGRPMTVTQQISGSNFTTNWSRGTFIGSNGDGPQNPYSGMLADFDVFAGGSFINPTDPSVIDGFYNVESGFAARKAANGGGVVPGRSPQIHLSGPPIIFPLNHASGTWTWPATFSGTSPSSTFTTIGALREAMKDPFEPGSPF